MENTLLKAAAIALALGMENRNDIPKNKEIPVNTSAVKAAIQTAKKALQAMIKSSSEH